MIGPRLLKISKYLNGENMKPIFISMVASVGLMVAGSVPAVDMPAEGKSKCAVCHAIDKKVVGPAWNDVAAKYKGDKDAAGKIAANITKGGAFGWKMGIMPAKGMGASDAEIKSLSQFIAGLATPAKAKAAAPAKAEAKKEKTK